MSMVNADSVQLFAMLKKMQDSISSIETTKKSVKMKYEQLGAGWQDKKYNELGVVVRDCNKALNDILVIMLQAEKYVALLAKSLSEYESVQLGSTNGISASTPQTSSFAVTPSSADTTTFESNTFGSNLAFVQDRLSAERYFSRGNHYEEYRDYWENGNYTFSRNENPELVYVRARDIEGVYLSDRELGNPEGFWTRNGREGWSRENILRRASHIQDVRQNTESGMSLDELSQNPVLDDTIRSYYNNPVQVALGRQTLCITDGLLLLSDDMILGILAHEIGHLSYGHTVIQLLIGGGNIFISGCLLLIKISYWIFSAIMGLFAICSRSGVMGIITAVFAGISTALSWLWVKFCMLFLMWSMRQNEYLADEFAYKIGFGLELATVLDQHISDVPHDGFLSAIYSTHPCNDDRVAALQNLGVPYSRY